MNMLITKDEQSRWWVGNGVQGPVKINNYIHIIREYDSTLYVGLARAVSPTNTNLRLTFLLTRLQEALYESNFKFIHFPR